MRNSLRFAVVLFFLGLLSIVSLMGGDTAEHWAVGGPESDLPLIGGVSLETEDSLTAEGPGNHFTSVSSSDVDMDKSVALTTAAGAVEVAANPTDAVVVETMVAADGESTAGQPVVDASVEAEAPAEVPAPKPTVVTHVVQRGETLWDIALSYGVDVDTIVAANDIVDINRLRVGEQLKVLTVRGALHTVERGESLWDISRTYNVSMDEIIATNELVDPSRLQVRQQLIIPGGQAQAVALRREALVSSSGQLVRNFDWPARGRISSRYGPRWGRMHHGLDLAIPIGTPIRASAAGTVTYSGAMGTYGIIVIIDHGNGVETRYAHLSRNLVSPGQRVQRGALIAYSGNTGNSTGPHLHFEIRHRGQSVDPEMYLKR